MAARERVSGCCVRSHPVMMCVQENTNREGLLIYRVVNLSKRDYFSNCLSHPHYLFHPSAVALWAALQCSRGLSRSGLLAPSRGPVVSTRSRRTLSYREEGVNQCVQLAPSRAARGQHE